METINTMTINEEDEQITSDVVDEEARENISQLFQEVADIKDDLNELNNGFYPIEAIFEQGAYNASGSTSTQTSAVKATFNSDGSKVIIKNSGENHAWLIIGNNTSADAESGWEKITGTAPAETTIVSNYFCDSYIEFEGYLYYRVTERIIVDGTLETIAPDDAQIKIYQSSAITDLISDEARKRETADNVLHLYDRVGAMVEVAESHFEKAFGENVGLVYQSNHGTGLFYESPYYKYSEETDIEEYDGKMPVTNCSQFMSTLSKGVYYDGSRYVGKNDNEYSEWAFFSDGTGKYPDANYDSMSAEGMAEYAKEHGWLKQMDENRCDIHAGDFAFFLDSDTSDSESLNIGHIALVIHVGRSSKTVEVLEGWDFTRPDEKKSGVREHIYSFKNIAYYAKFPICDSLYKTKKLYDTSDIVESKANERENNVLISRVDSKLDFAAGMYTFVVNGEFDDNVMPYVSYHVKDVSQYVKNSFVRCGNNYIRTVYIPWNADIVNINANKEFDCKVNKLAIYKGYIRIDSKFI